MSKFRFEYIDDDYVTEEVYGTTTVEFSEDTWPVAARRFVDFLRGAGFVLTEQDVLELMRESVYEYDKANGVASSHCGLDAAGE